LKLISGLTGENVSNVIPLESPMMVIPGSFKVNELRSDGMVAKLASKVTEPDIVDEVEEGDCGVEEVWLEFGDDGGEEDPEGTVFVETVFVTFIYIINK
jgi:hypothetical protein